MTITSGELGVSKKPFNWDVARPYYLSIDGSSTACKWEYFTDKEIILSSDKRLLKEVVNAISRVVAELIAIEEQRQAK